MNVCLESLHICQALAKGGLRGKLQGRKRKRGLASFCLNPVCFPSSQQCFFTAAGPSSSKAWVQFAVSLTLTVQSSLHTCGGLVPGPLMNTKMQGCSSPIYKMAQLSGPVYPGVLHPRIWRADCTTPWSHTSEKPALLANWHPLLEVCMPAPRGPSSRNPAPAQQLPRRDLSSNPSMNFSVLICLFALFPNLRTALLVLVPSMIP